MTAPEGLLLVKDHVFPRQAATIVGVVAGIGIGIGNAMLGVLFPSWLEHGVGQNLTDGERISMSFNVDLVGVPPPPPGAAPG